MHFSQPASNAGYPARKDPPWRVEQEKRKQDREKMRRRKKGRSPCGKEWMMLEAEFEVPKERPSEITRPGVLGSD